MGRSAGVALVIPAAISIRLICASSATHLPTLCSASCASQTSSTTCASPSDQLAQPSLFDSTITSRNRSRAISSMSMILLARNRAWKELCDEERVSSHAPETVKL